MTTESDTNRVKAEDIKSQTREAGWGIQTIGSMASGIVHVDLWPEEAFQKEDDDRVKICFDGNLNSPLLQGIVEVLPELFQQAS